MFIKNKIFKTIFFSFLLIFAIIGFFYIIILLFNSGRNYPASEGISVDHDSSAQNVSNEKTEEFSFHYSDPQKIIGSNYSIMKVIANGGGNSAKETFKRANYNEPYIINIMFFNLADNQFHLLFNKKALLLGTYSTYNKNDSSASRLFYNAITYDSNRDGYLNEEDNHVLYASDKNGQNLFQITDSKVNLEDYIFLDKNTLLITVSIPNKEQVRGNWQKKYIQFDISQNNSISGNKFNASYLDAINIFKK